MTQRVVLLFSLFFVAAASATMVKPMTVEQLTSGSSAVVEGQSVETWTGWNATHSRIYTYTRVKVARALKGSPSDTIVVKQLGGSAGGYTQHVAGVRAMSTGERAVLFLRPSTTGDGTMVIVGLMQGHFRIARDNTTGTDYVSNGTPDGEELSGNTVKRYRGSALKLSELEARVRKAVPRE
ncbi:MAG TPA: hypothetical protein VN577_00350 [Terriglobales bacterium]|nr:hypothetical protein [Terriglobales bacterium]